MVSKNKLFGLLNHRSICAYFDIIQLAEPQVILEDAGGYIYDITNNWEANLIRLEDCK